MSAETLIKAVAGLVMIVFMIAPYVYFIMALQNSVFPLLQKTMDYVRRVISISMDVVQNSNILGGGINATAAEDYQHYLNAVISNYTDILRELCNETNTPHISWKWRLHMKNNIFFFYS